MQKNSFKTLKLEEEGKILVVTLNRPDNLNAVSREMHGEIETLLESLAEDGGANVVVLTGAGRAFSAGGDIRGMKERASKPYELKTQDLRETFRGAARLIDLMLNSEIPIIAAVNGPASGLGATLALMSDVVIASDKAKFNDAHVSVGIVPGDGGCLIWPLLVGIHKAKYYLMTGDNIEAAEAEKMGLVNKVVPHEELMPVAIELARRLAGGPTLAINWTKKTINKLLKQNANLLMDTSLAWEELTFHSEDHTEAVDAFLEKREAKFKGI